MTQKQSEKIVIIAYTGTGKTETAKRYKGIFNPSSDDFRYIFDKNLPPEQRKSNPNRIENPDFPNNFINAVSKGLEKNDIVLLALTQKLYSLYQSKEFKDKIKNARVILACPPKECFGDYEKLFKARGNTETFIENRRKEFPRIIEIFENAKSEKIAVQSGQYLDDALVKYGIKLQPK